MNESLVGEACSLASLVGRMADEFLRRQEAGERPDVEEYVARYPQAAEVLRKVLASLQLLRGSFTGQGVPAGDSADEPTGTLGDFRLIREVGRGGMGVVYEAEQISLGRRVALKVLPFAATMDPRQLQRFHNEARAAASLHHTNIVPVHGVGCERGVHYYAMQFIEGRTLADLIAEQKGASSSLVPTMDAAEAEAAAASAPTVPRAVQATSAAPRDAAYFRRAAEWGIQAAEALDCAHTLGVVHRDVNPANLMVDATGRLWVTDFGLAHMKSDARLTMTGDLLGTLRYMSPEQALAKRVVVDHRTDIYSLGATLYELLTLEPAYTGGDRQELLRQIAFEEPKPPRRLNRSIPVELETIVLKAMEKNPADRYATAKELADDLRRFLEDKAIRAKRPTLRQRAGKWARRHRAFVRATTALVLALLLLGGAAMWREQRQRAAAVRVVEAGLAQAELLQQQERWEEARAVLAVAAGELEGRGPEALRERVEQRKRDVDLLIQLEEARLQAASGNMGAGPDLEGADRLYWGAFEEYGLDVAALAPQEAAERVRASAIRTRLIAGLDHWASVRDQLAKGNGASLRAVADQADEDPWRRRLREAVGRGDRAALEELAGDEGTLSQPPPSLMLLAIGLLNADSVGPAERLLRRLQARKPADFWFNFALANALGKKMPPDPAERIRFYQAALVIRPQSSRVYVNLSNALYEQGKLEEAEAASRKAIEFKPDYAEAHGDLSSILLAQGKPAEAEAACRKAIELKHDLAEAHNNLGNILQAQGRPAEAEAAFRTAIELKPNLAVPHYNLGLSLRDQGKLTDAEAAYRRAIELKHDYAEAYNGLGITLDDQGKLTEAEAACRKAIKLKPDLAEAHGNLGTTLLAQGKPTETEAACRKAIELKPDLAEAHCILGNALYVQGKLVEAEVAYRRAIELKPKYAKFHYSLGLALHNQGKQAEAVAAYQKAITLKPDFAEAHCNLGKVLQQQGHFADALAAKKRGHELGSRQPNWRNPSAQWVREAERLVELDAKLSRVLNGDVQPADVGERLALARICQLPCKSLHAAAVRFYTDAFAEQPTLADDLQHQPRYNAACAAALAGSGRGKDAGGLPDKDYVRLRTQALKWLRDDLAAWRKVLEKYADKARPAVAQQLAHWLEDTDFAGVRGPEALARLPETERNEWQRLWEEVEALRTKAAASPKP